MDLSGLILFLAACFASFWRVRCHPAYPVFSDFSLDIPARGKRGILMGSSSD